MLTIGVMEECQVASVETAPSFSRWRRPAALAGVVLALTLGGCAGRGSVASAPPPPSATRPAVPATEPVAASRESTANAPAGAPRDTHENLHAVLWMQQSAEYRAAAIGAYARAQLLLDRALEQPQHTAALEQAGQPLPMPTAVVLDVDETVLDNSPFQAEQVRRRAGRFNPSLWTQWVTQASAAPIPGVAEFLAHARERGVKTVFVTNRDALTEKTATIENLRRHGFDATAENVLCAGERGWTRDKRVRRDYVAKQYRILLLVGDDLGDFVTVQGLDVAQRASLIDKYATFWKDRWVVVPNPAYGSWEAAAAAGAGESDDAVLEHKRGLLRGVP